MVAPAEALDPKMKPESISKEISTAFHELASKKPALVERFQQTFQERAAIPGLSESRGGVDGMTETLASLLGMFPEESGEMATLAEGTTRGGSGNVPPDFDREFSAALKKVVTEHPLSLILFKKHQLADSRPTEKYFAALLETYSTHEVGYSY